MALEKKIEEYHGPGADPSMSYDYGSEEIRAKFCSKLEELSDLEEYYGKLRENEGDIDALNDLARVILGFVPKDKRDEAAAMMRNPYTAMENADVLISEGYINTARFVESNRDAIFDRLSAEQLYAIFDKAPLFKTGNEKHDRIADVKTKIMQMQQASQKGENPGSVLQKEIAELTKKIPEEQRAFMKKNAGAMNSSLVSAVIGGISEVYGTIFRLPNGKLDRGELRTYLEDNYKVIEDLVDDRGKKDWEILSAKEKFNRWDKNLKMQYVEIAKVLYKSEKPIWKRKENEDKEDRKERDKKRGIRT